MPTPPAAPTAPPAPRIPDGLKRTRILLGILFLLALSPAPAPAQVKSRERLKTVYELVRAYGQNNGYAEVTPAQALDDIARQFAAVDDCPLRPRGAAWTLEQCQDKAATRAEAETREKFPDLDEADLEAEAEAKFPIIELGSEVSVRYAPNPGRLLPLEGKFTALKGEWVTVGRQTVRLRDIVANDDGTGAGLAFDAEASRKKRLEHVAARLRVHEAARTNFRNEKTEQYFAAERDAAIEHNEAAGYVWSQGKWQPLRAIMSEMIRLDTEAWQKAKEKAEREAELAAAQAAGDPAAATVGPDGIPANFGVQPGGMPMLDAHGNPLPMPPMVDAKGNPIPMPPMLDAQGRPMMMPGEVDAQGRPIPPRQATKPTPGARPALPRFLQPGGQQPEPGTPDQSPPPVEPGTAPDPDAETVAAAPDATAEIPADAPREVTLGAPSMPPPEGLAPAGAPPPPPLPRAPTVPPPPAPPPQETGGGSAWKWMAAVGVAILGLIVLGVVMSDSLLKGKGKARCVATKEDAEKRFWAKAGQDPARCPFCAYAFPSEEEANTALSGLSFMGQDSRDPGGRLVSAEPITFGVYPDGGEFVAFVGGAALNYRLWREAREVLGKGREYRLSPPPAPAAEVPTVPGIDHVSDSEGEPGDFCFYRRYRAPDKMAAMAFLAQVKIKAAGVEVVVETPEGDCARNLAGIRELE